MKISFINFLNRFNNILYYFLTLLLTFKLNFFKLNNIIIYYNNVIFLKI